MSTIFASCGKQGGQGSVLNVKPESVQILQKLQTQKLEQFESAKSPSAPTNQSVLEVVNSRDQLIPPTATCQGNELLPRRIWMLTSDQILNAIEDTFGTESVKAVTLPNKEVSFGHANTASTMLSDKNFLKEYFNKLETVSENIVAQNPTVKLCAQNFNTQCANEIATNFGKLLWRRSLTQAELLKLVTNSQALATETSGLNAVKGLIQFLLTSPNFLYRSEWGTDIPNDANKVQLSGDEVATFLAMTIWRSVPDAILLNAAKMGELQIPAKMKMQIDRMLASPKAKRSVNAFFESWLQYDRIKTVAKVSELNLTPEIREALYAESKMFFENLVFENNYTTQKLFTSNITFGDSKTAAWYGVDASQINAGKFAVPKDQRLGPLSHAAFIASQSKPNQTSFIHRGVFMLRQVLCKDIPPPPPNINSSVALPMNAKSGPIMMRDTFQAHSASPTCAGCHKLIDPVAAAFEIYDAVGKFRTHEGEGLIDSSGQLPELGDLQSKFASGIALLESVGNSEHLQQCLYTNYVRHSFGFSSQEQRDNLKNGCEISKSYQNFKENGAIVKSLPLAFGNFESVLFRKKESLK